jgi:hypothetical protein
MFGWLIGRNKGFQPNTLPNLQLWLPADRIGVQGYSLDFDGTDDFVEANNVITDYPFTLECWVRLDVTNVNHRIFGICNTTANNVRYSLGYSVGNGKFSLQAQNTSVVDNVSTTTATANVWFHLAGVFTSATSRTLYVNGLSESTGTDNVAFNNSANNKVEMGRHFTTSFYLDGKLSDVRIWNTARTAQQIADNYNKRLIGNESGLVGYWKLDKGSGTTVADSTTNANAGTISGAIWDNNEPFTEPIDDGTAVRLWSDQSGNGYDATQGTSAARPTYIASGLNGLPVVRFDGTDDRLALGASALGILRNVAGATVFIAVKYSSTTGNFPSFYASTNGAITSVRLSIRTSTTPTYQISGRRLDANSVETISSNQATSTSSVIIHTARADYQNTLMQQYINGTLDGQKTDFQTAGNTSDTDSIGILIGNNGASVFLNGDIAEIILYNRALNDSELAQVHRYLARKWGIALA